MVRQSQLSTGTPAAPSHPKWYWSVFRVRARLRPNSCLPSLPAPIPPWIPASGFSASSPGSREFRPAVRMNPQCELRRSQPEARCGDCRRQIKRPEERPKVPATASKRAQQRQVAVSALFASQTPVCPRRCEGVMASLLAPWIFGADTPLPRSGRRHGEDGSCQHSPWQ
ncbi:hypothetical protein VUR80DRAFT_2542 [Thermomyces stellatus]